mmetsp:Transcript_15772/g.20195  ORF Transcript_15772/g.20195 Transcript_15772/m.20195 type:complete len:385 (-) Transcript_15772:195-1349(-)
MRLWDKFILTIPICVSGPGCSSEVALFGENGPCIVNANGTDTFPNKYSWNSKASLLYIDQPTGTGFSYGTSMDHNEQGVATDMYDFLQLFFKSHPKYQKLDFYAIGESYAGHYIPATTHMIYKNNQNLPAGAVHINLKGTSVGNGLVAPATQYKYYEKMIVSSNNHKPAVGMVVHELMKAVTGPCVAAIKLCDEKSIPGSCFAAIEVCNAGLMIPYMLTGRNVYDMREKCAKPPLCYDFSNVKKYLSRVEVRKTLGVGSHSWSDCNHLVALEFELAGDWMRNYEYMLPDQLENGIKVLIYAGDQDYICNWLGNQAWTRELNWKFKEEFNAANVKEWKVDGAVAGTIQSAKGFTFLRVNNAGHMVPRDQPKRALAMVNAFISGKI